MNTKSRLEREQNSAGKESHLVPGQSMIMVTGPLAGLQGAVQEQRDDNRILVELGKGVSIVIGTSSLRPTIPAHAPRE